MNARLQFLLRSPSIAGSFSTLYNFGFLAASLDRECPTGGYLVGGRHTSTSRTKSGEKYCVMPF